MHYVSTRGEAPVLGFADVLLTGLARDGGLYVPQHWPTLSPDSIAALAGRPYAVAALAVIEPFIDGEIGREALSAMIEDAYAGFHHPAVAPLVQIGANDWVLELFHGPTLAFKDIAMQLLARLMDHVLAARGSRATIVGATSGDTGGAAIEAFRGRDRVDVVILYPEGRVSDVQRRQMTTVRDGNVHTLAVRGTFDDCQALVKAMFNDHAFRDSVNLAGVNSINWARIMAQTVYFFTAAVALGAPHRPVSFVVPTGNFGDIFAGHVARRMGLPIERLVIATNSNDILVRTLETGRYEPAGVHATSSPSMDIQVSSNFERLLFEAGGREAAGLRAMMGGLAQSGSFAVPDAALAAIREEFAAERSDEGATAAAMAATLAATGMIVDPHTAVGLHAAAHYRGHAPTVTLATAHPAKFPDAVAAACGRHPTLPPRAAGILEAPERTTVVDNDIAAIRRAVRERSRAQAVA